MQTFLRITFCALLAAAPCVQAQTDDVVRIVNRLRAPGAACAAAAPPLAPHDALDATASRLARGATLESALKSAGYRMTEVQVITLAGDGVHARLEELLATRFCAKIGMPQLAEAGVYEHGNKIWIVLAAPFAPKVSLTRQQVAERMLALVNAARAAARNCGGKQFDAARPLRWSQALEKSAASHAADMAANSYFSHTGRDGSTSAQRVARAGYDYRMTGENIAAGQLSPDEAVAGWIKSPGHCANLMQSAYTEMGVAYSVNTTSKMGVYWVQNFGVPR